MSRTGVFIAHVFCAAIMIAISSSPSATPIMYGAMLGSASSLLMHWWRK